MKRLQYGVYTKFFSLVLLILLPLFIYSGHRILNTVGRQIDNHLSANQEIAEVSALSFVNYLEKLWAAQHSIGSFLELQRRGLSLDDQEFRDFMRLQLRTHSIVSEFAFIDENGIISESTNPKWLGFNVSEREYYERALAGEQTYISHLMRERITEAAALIVSYALYSNSDFHGVINSYVTVKELSKALPTTYDGQAVIVFVDNRGNLVYCSRASDGVLGNILPQESVGWEAIEHGKTASSRNTVIEEGPLAGSWIETAVSVPDLGWTVLALTNRAPVIATAYKEGARSLLVLALVATGSLLLAGLSVKQLLARLARLQEAAQAFAGGGVSRRVEVDRKGDFWRVGSSFNAMADRLETVLRRESFLGQVSSWAIEKTQASELFQRVIDFLADELNAQSIVLWLNGSDQYHRLVAGKTDAATGKSNPHVFHIGSLDDASARLELCLAEGENLSVQDRGFLEATAQLLGVIAASIRQHHQLCESESRFRLLVNGIKEYAIILISTNGDISSWNEGARHITGYSGEEITGKQLDVLGSSFREFDRLLNKAAQEGSYKFASWIVRKDGTRFWGNIFLSAVTESDGHLRGFIALINDGTSSARFLRIAAHELRNPLTTIKGLAGLVGYRLRSGMDNHKSIESLEMMEQQIDKLSKMLDDVLEGFRIQTGHLQLTKDKMELIPLLTEIVKPLNELASHNINLEYTSDARNCQVLGDRRRLEEVFTNLINNAIKYSPADKPIDVSVTTDEDKLRVAVRDYGNGIPQADQENIFSSFYRVKRKGRDPGGMGLGLYICKNLVESHQGRIWVESKEQHGATFLVELPCRKPEIK